jgi:hypothetical protein
MDQNLPETPSQNPPSQTPDMVQTPAPTTPDLIPPKPPRIPINWHNIISMLVVAGLSSLITYLVIKPPAFLSFAPTVPVLTTPTPTTTPVPTPVWKTYTKGKIPSLATLGFSINYPPRWQENIEFTNPKGNEDEGFTFRLSFQKHIIRIQQGPVPVAICIFDNDVAPDGIIVSDYRGKKFTDLIPLFGSLKRVQVDSVGAATSNFLFCENKRPENEYYATPTKIGHITYEMPLDYTPALLLEMDEIVKTLKSF